MRKILNKYQFSDMSILYVSDDNERVELVLCPFSNEKDICLSKAGVADSLIQFMVEGDATSSGFIQGHSERNSESVARLKYIEQKSFTENGVTTIETYFAYKESLRLIHRLIYRDGDRAITVNTSALNIGDDEISLTSLFSFSLGMITPFDEGETFNRLNYYRIRSKWSTEGRVEKGSIEDLQLQPNWARHGVADEKFGQIGSMPVRKFFPFAALEDSEAGVVWAAQLALGSSWQMEFYRRDESLCMSGGIADYEFGHFLRTLKSGESFTAPDAYLTVCRGSFDETCQRLLDCHKVSDLFRGEGKRLPYVFNEYCTTWGNPSHENIAKIIDVVKDKGFDYFVIDAGWYSAGELGWQNNMGDWKVADNLFPEGLKRTVDMIKAAGMKPGLWFELEVVGELAEALQYTDHLLKRNGKIIKSGERFFWDMRDPWTKDYLKKKVIDLLNENGFEYVKIDYNEAIGIGCDGAESYGSGLYDAIEATKEFFREIHRSVPGICIELCASGGHRLEPSFLNITDMASFSDAHECPEIPVVAANLHRVIRPEKSQIWCVVREEDSDVRLCHSLCSAMLGVLCISGDVFNLSERQWQLIDDARDFYRAIDEIIKDGRSEFYGIPQRSYRKLENWQGILRRSADGNEAAVFINSFSANQHVEINVGDDFEIIRQFEERPHTVNIEKGILSLDTEVEYEALALLLKRK